MTDQEHFDYEPAVGPSVYRLNKPLLMHIMGNEDGQCVLESFLNSFMEPRKLRVTKYIDFRYTLPYEELTARFDVLAADSKNKAFHVVVLASAEKFTTSRCFYITAATYAERSQQTFRIPECPVLLVALLDSICTPEAQHQDVYSRYCLMDTKDHSVFPNSFEFHTFELPKLANSSKDKKYIPWVQYFASTANTSDPAMQTIIGDDAALKEAVLRETQFFNVPSLCEKYQEEEKHRRNLLRTFESYRHEGQAETKATIARNLAQEGVDQQIIAKACQLKNPFGKL